MLRKTHNIKNRSLFFLADDKDIKPLFPTEQGFLRFGMFRNKSCLPINLPIDWFETIQGRIKGVLLQGVCEKVQTLG